MTEEKRKVQALLRLLCLVLVLAVLILTLVKELSRVEASYSFETIALADYTHTDTLTGYVFRDEVAPASTNNGPVHYLVGEGETVRAGTVLAEVFRDDTGTDKRERRRCTPRSKPCKPPLRKRAIGKTHTLPITLP